MSTARVLTLIAAFAAFATSSAAQTPVTDGETASMPRTKTGSDVQPVMDQAIFAHVLFNEFEGRWNGSNSEFRWDGQGWVGTDYDRLWIKSEGTLQGNGTLEDGQQQFLYDRAIRPISICRAGCAAISIHGPRAIGQRSAFRALHPISSISRSPALSAARAISPPSSKPPTIF